MKKISWHELKPQVKEVWVLSLPGYFNADHNHRDAVYRFRHGGFARCERFGGDPVWYPRAHGCWAALHTPFRQAFPCRWRITSARDAMRKREAWCVTACARRCAWQGFCARWGFSIHSMLPTWLGGDPAIRYDASKYFMVYALMIPFSQINSLNSSFLQCSGDMLTPSILNAAMCLLDVVFNTIFIPHFGVMGAGIGTASACAVVSLTMAWRCLLCNPHLRLNRKETEKHGFNPEILKKALKIGLPVGVQEIAMCSAQVVATMIIAPLGAVSIAANSFAVTAESLCYMPGYGIGSAATTLVGRNIGAGKDRPCQALRQHLYRDGRGLYGDNGTFDDVPVPVCIQHFDARSLRPRACGAGVAHRVAG